ncbi:hypothetical protein ACTXT7_013747 [Hymenolepis weldensis]
MKAPQQRLSISNDESLKSGGKGDKVKGSNCGSFTYDVKVCGRAWSRQCMVGLARAVIGYDVTAFPTLLKQHNPLPNPPPGDVTCGIAACDSCCLALGEWQIVEVFINCVSKSTFNVSNLERHVRACIDTKDQTLENEVCQKIIVLKSRIIWPKYANVLENFAVILKVLSKCDLKCTSSKKIEMPDKTLKSSARDLTYIHLTNQAVLVLNPQAPNISLRNTRPPQLSE